MKGGGEAEGCRSADRARQRVARQRIAHRRRVPLAAARDQNAAPVQLGRDRVQAGDALARKASI